MDYNRVVESLGRKIDFPALSYEEAKERLNKAMKIYNGNDNDFNLNEKIRLASEIELMRDQMAWYNGYSDLKGSEGEDDFLLFIVPGSTYDPDPESTKAQQLRDYKDVVKADLARYYKYSPKMLNKREKLTKDLIDSSLRLHEAFGKFGKDVRLEHEGEVISYNDLLSFDNAIKELIKEKKYIDKAKHVRNPFKLAHQGYTGRYKKIVVTMNTKRWINTEPRLKKVIEYMDSVYEEQEDQPFNLVEAGMMIYKALETLIRIVLHGNNEHYIKDDGKKSTRYKTTDPMKKYLGTDAYVNVFGVSKLARSLITDPSYEIEKEFAGNNEMIDTKNIKYDVFIDQMASVQQFYDIIREDEDYFK